MSGQLNRWTILIENQEKETAHISMSKRKIIL